MKNSKSQEAKGKKIATATTLKHNGYFMKKRGRISTAGRIGIAAGILLIMTGGLWIGAEAWISSRIAHLMKEPLNMNGDSYTVRAGRTRVSLAKRKVSVSGIEIASQAAKNVSAPVVSVRIAEVEASGIAIHGRRKERKITVEQLSVDSPEIMYEGVPRSSDSIRKTSVPSREIEIGELLLTNGNFRGGIWTKDGKECFGVGNLRIHISGISIDKALKEKYADWSQGKGSLVGGFGLSADSLSFSYENGAMRLEIAGIEGGSHGSGSIKTLMLEPQYSKEQFSLRDVRHKDWMRVEMRDIVCDGIGFPVSGSGRELKVDSIGIGRLGISSYKDRNQQQNSAPRLTFYETLNRLPIGMEIGEVEIADADIVYEEISEGFREAGTVTLDEMAIRISNVKKEHGGDNAMYEVKAKGRVLESALFESELRIMADSSGGRFEMHTRSGPMSAVLASAVTEPIAGIKIVSGDIESITVEITGNYTNAHSLIRMSYEDLEIAIMRRDGLKERRMLSAIANDFVLRRSNPARGHFKEGSGTYERDPYKSFWNYLWKTSMAGILDVVM